MEAELLKKNYMDASLAGSLSGLQSFYRALKSRGVKISKSKVKDWLQSQETYTLHKPARKKYARNKVITQGIDDVWQMDLVDMSRFAKSNSGFKFLITCIDVFSKFAWVIPIRNKSADVVLNGFREILKGKRKPDKLQTDRGTEFINSKFAKLLKENNIQLYSVNSELKASVVERFNRTIKERMFRYFTYRNSYEYLDILQDLVTAYNDSYHRTIKMKPKNVVKKIENHLRKTVYENLNNETVMFKLKIDDTVRISKYKNIFAKGYTPNWTEEVFIVTEIIPRIPPVYRIKDLNNETVEGVFYESELQKVIKEDDVYKVDQILKKRKRNGVTEFFVSWLGYPVSFNSWIKQSDILK
jgi:transposase InsO family protein